MKEEKGYISEISQKKKKYFYIALGIYIFAFILLSTIGSAINENGYLLRAFITPVLFLIAIIAIPYVLYKKK